MKLLFYLFLCLFTVNALSSEMAEPSLKKATFGAGCFWCVEAVFEKIEGVTSVQSGYMGGQKKATYEEVCSGNTGHAEVVQLEFDPKKISYSTLLEWFWKLHDPTTLNRQGADVGTQYRSVIFYHNEAQKSQAEESKKHAQEKFSNPIVTEIKLATPFYVAEKYHQNYFQNNKNAPYCRAVILPKMEKLKLNTPTVSK